MKLHTVPPSGFRTIHFQNTKLYLYLAFDTLPIMFTADYIFRFVFPGLFYCLACYIAAPQVNEACNHNQFNGHDRLKDSSSSSPGLFSDADGESDSRRFGGGRVALVLSAVSLFALAGFKAIEDRRGRYATMQQLDFTCVSVLFYFLFVVVVRTHVREQYCRESESSSLTPGCRHLHITSLPGNFVAYNFVACGGFNSRPLVPLAPKISALPPPHSPPHLPHIRWCRSFLPCRGVGVHGSSGEQQAISDTYDRVQVGLNLHRPLWYSWC